MSATVKHASGQHDCPINAHGSKSLSSGWDRAHERLAREDEERSEWLWKQIRNEGKQHRCRYCKSQIASGDECRRCRNRLHMAAKRRANRA